MKSFSAGACTWQKIHIRLQVWNLFAEANKLCAQQTAILLSEKPEGVFRQSQKRLPNRAVSFSCQSGLRSSRNAAVTIIGSPPIRPIISGPRSSQLL